MFKFLEILLTTGLISFIVICGGYWFIMKACRMKQAYKERQQKDK